MHAVCNYQAELGIIAYWTTVILVRMFWDLLTGQAKIVQSLLWGRVEVWREDDSTIRHEEIISAVGAPQTHETHSAVVEGLRDLHHGCQLIVANNSPHHHMKTTSIHSCTTIQCCAAHSKVLHAHVHDTWKTSNAFCQWHYWCFVFLNLCLLMSTGLHGLQLCVCVFLFTNFDWDLDTIDKHLQPVCFRCTPPFNLKINANLFFGFLLSLDGILAI